ncbi:hypothetical protein K466DRAFT_612692 [Polyporus arcularius HHB13444]|uniref:TNase-like domain-containing protein n=1 Tax=Polyporus arcularius HHB13444 TaxID=1314778 RepID=A0A5C3PHJ3_9APHY|nr:hypothetical protein K466DRAFT_612692 [Polyporus arcularius HHB13444]
MQAGLAGAVVTTFLLAKPVLVRYFPRISNAERVTSDMLGGKTWLKGFVTRVGDSDNFRLYHTPGFGWKWFRRIPADQANLVGETIHIRMAGMYRRARAFAGRDPQTGAKEGLAWLKKRIEGKFVHCQLFERDHYGRIIAAVHLKPRFVPCFLFTGTNVAAETSLSLKMLRAGLATVYEQQGAVYGHYGLSQFKMAEKEAQRHKRGIWKNGINIETPAQFKRRVRDTQVTDRESVSPAPSTDDTIRRS